MGYVRVGVGVGAFPLVTSNKAAATASFRSAFVRGLTSAATAGGGDGVSIAATAVLTAASIVACNCSSPIMDVQEANIRTMIPPAAFNVLLI